MQGPPEVVLGVCLPHMYQTLVIESCSLISQHALSPVPLCLGPCKFLPGPLQGTPPLNTHFFWKNPAHPSISTHMLPPLESHLLCADGLSEFFLVTRRPYAQCQDKGLMQSSLEDATGSSTPEPHMLPRLTTDIWEKMGRNVGTWPYPLER